MPPRGDGRQPISRGRYRPLNERRRARRPRRRVAWPSQRLTPALTFAGAASMVRGVRVDVPLESDSSRALVLGFPLRPRVLLTRLINHLLMGSLGAVVITSGCGTETACPTGSAGSPCRLVTGVGDAPEPSPLANDAADATASDTDSSTTDGSTPVDLPPDDSLELDGDAAETEPDVGAVQSTPNAHVVAGQTTLDGSRHAAFARERGGPGITAHSEVRSAPPHEFARSAMLLIHDELHARHVVRRWSPPAGSEGANPA